MYISVLKKKTFELTFEFFFLLKEFKKHQRTKICCSCRVKKKTRVATEALNVREYKAKSMEHHNNSHSFGPSTKNRRRVEESKQTISTLLFLFILF